MLLHTQGAEGRPVTHTTDHLTNLAQNQHCKLTHVFTGWGRELSHISNPVSVGINGLVERATPALQQLFLLVLQGGKGEGEGRRGSDQTCLNLTHQLIHPRRVCLCVEYELMYCACLQPEYKEVGRFTIKGTLPIMICH